MNSVLLALSVCGVVAHLCAVVWYASGFADDPEEGLDKQEPSELE